MIKISIIFAYRNREIERVKRCMDSLKIQSYKSFEVIFIDSGSDMPYKVKSEQLMHSYSFANYIYNDTRGMPWNKAHALNIGIRVAKGKYILTSDIDMIYSENILKEAIGQIKANYQLNSMVYFLPKSFSNWESLRDKPLNFPKSNTDGKGGFHLVEKKKIESINGYDEYFSFWGIEDRDLFHRLDQLGLKSIWLTLTYTPIYHQWHPLTSNSQKNWPNKWWDNMNIHFAINKKVIKRNKDNWGKLYTKESRPTLQYLETPSNFKVITYKIPNNRKRYLKSNVITAIMDKIMSLSLHEILKISYPKSLKKGIYFLNFINKVFSKIDSSQFIVNKNQYQKIIDDNYFIPSQDIPYIIWMLIKDREIISDYYFDESGDNITYLISKK